MSPYYGIAFEIGNNCGWKRSTACTNKSCMAQSSRECGVCAFALVCCCSFRLFTSSPLPLPTQNPQMPFSNGQSDPFRGLPYGVPRPRNHFLNTPKPIETYGRLPLRNGNSSQKSPNSMGLLNLPSSAKDAILGAVQHPKSYARIQEIEAPKPKPQEVPELPKEVCLLTICNILCFWFVDNSILKHFILNIDI